MTDAAITQSKHAAWALVSARLLRVKGGIVLRMPDATNGPAQPSPKYFRHRSIWPRCRVLSWKQGGDSTARLWRDPRRADPAFVSMKLALTWALTAEVD